MMKWSQKPCCVDQFHRKKKHVILVGIRATDVHGKGGRIHYTGMFDNLSLPRLL